MAQFFQGKNCRNFEVIYDDPAASQFVWGVAYHWYGRAARCKTDVDVVSNVVAACEKHPLEVTRALRHGHLGQR